MRVTLVGHSPIQISLYLAQSAERHTGGERPSDLLNGHDEFIPATDLEGGFLTFRRGAVVVLSVGVEYEQDGPELTAESGDELTTIPVEVQLEDGVSVSGELAFWREDSQRRLQDYLNSADPFLPVHDGHTIHLINRDRVVSVVATQ